MAKISQKSLDEARDHLARAAAEMERAVVALGAARDSEAGARRDRLAMIGEVVSTQRDMAAGLAAVVKGGDEQVDLLFASLAFGRDREGGGRH